MQGQQDSQRGLFDTIDLDSLIPEDHLLRRIDASIDFDFIYAVTKDLYCADNGHNSIDPVLFFRMQLISYLCGMKGDRELCREVRLTLKTLEILRNNSRFLVSLGFRRHPDLRRVLPRN
jgi:transposase